MSITVRNPSANPSNISQASADVVVSAVLISTTEAKVTVEVTFTPVGTCANATAPTKKVTIDAAAETADAQAPVSQTVKVTTGGARPCSDAIAIKVWKEGAVGAPGGLLSSNFALVNML